MRVNVNDIWTSQEGGLNLDCDLEKHFEFSDIYHYHRGTYPLNAEEARALADAIYAELGLGWLPYPNKDNTPDPGMLYDITYINWEDKPTTKPLGYQPELWKTMRVIAYRERPKPYQPEREE
jgi:hypothetical protein